MRVREPVVAGQFYAASADQCRLDLEQLLLAARAQGAAEHQPPKGTPLYGGLVPHAGWVYSGSVAARVFCALAEATRPQTIICFGGVHRSRGREAAMFADGRWDSPLGPMTIDSRLGERVLSQTNLIIDDPFAHEHEHSIEVQMPFMSRLFPGAKFLPIMVPPGPRAAEVGEAVGRTVLAYDYDAIVVGSTDLTHYGPHYGFVPQGVGAAGNAWAKTENDRRFIDLVCELRSSDVVQEAMQHKNACSSGAVAATLAAAAKLGATRGLLLQHTTSSEIMAQHFAEDAEDSVGYAGIVFA